jgi:hypothetical protein
MQSITFMVPYIGLSNNEPYFCRAKFKIENVSFKSSNIPNPSLEVLQLLIVQKCFLYIFLVCVTSC